MQCEEVIEHTLSLFLELASGLVLCFNKISPIPRVCFVNRHFKVACRYMTGKLLLKLDTVKFIIGHHTVILVLAQIVLLVH